MSTRGWRRRFDRHLVEGLTVDERIARLEGEIERLKAAPCRRWCLVRWLFDKGWL